mmetsp:Transcript_60077/g.139955  ORF Transcript_60077/g.139955 Transcript_60077/m.139955 type:complete len:341 (-) Transcript_60077:365-1387(-)
MVLHEPLNGVAQEVDSLLRSEAAHEGHHAHPAINLEPQLPLQSLLADLLAAHGCGSECGGDALVHNWVPRVINAIENPCKEEALRGERVVEAETALGRADLFGVAWRHGQDAVAADDRALGEVERLPGVALIGALVRRVLVKHVAQSREGKAQLAKVVVLVRRDAQAQRVATLVAKIVDDEQATGVVVVAVGTVPVLQVDRHKPCLPVIRDKRDLTSIAWGTTELNGHRDLEGGQGEQCKPEEVVLILCVIRRVVVQPPRPMEGRVVDEDIVAALAFAIRLEVVEVADFMLRAKDLKGLRALVERPLVVVVHGGDGHRAMPADCKVVGVGCCDNREAAGL